MEWEEKILASYLELLNRHGLKMWGSFMVGTLAAAIPMFVITFILIFVIIAVGFAGLSGIDPFSSPNAILGAIFNPGFIIIGMLSLLFILFLSLLTSAFTSAGSIGVVADGIQQDRTTVGTYFRYGFRRLFPMLGLNLVLFLLAIPPMIPLIIGIFAFSTEAVWGIVLGIILLLLTVILYIVYGLIVFHAPTALIAEQKGVFESLSASFHAFRSKFGQVLLSAVILFGISIAGGIITLLLEWLILGANPLDPYAEVHPLRSFLSIILMFPINTALQVIVISTLVYRYLRVIKPQPPEGGSPEPVTVAPTGPSPISGSEGSPEPPRQEP